MAYNFIQMPCKELHSKEDQFSWRLLVFTLNSENKTSAIVGSHFTSDFCINSLKFPCFLSRKHAMLKFIQEKLYIQDLESANGTFQNNVMLEPKVDYLLNDGDVIAFGNKNEVKAFPGEKIKAEDTPFLFRVLRVKSIRNAFVTKNADSTVIVISDDDEDNLPNPKEVSTNKEASVSFIPVSESTNDGRYINCKFSFKHSTFSTNQVLIETAKESGEHEQISTTEKASFCSNALHPKKRMFYDQSICKKQKRKCVIQPPLQKDYKVEEVIARNDAAVELCSSLTCQVLTVGSDSTITWVQCDSCDKWFHTACVGCNYDEVKRSNRQFYCEFCRPV